MSLDGEYRPDEEPVELDADVVDLDAGAVPADAPGDEAVDDLAAEAVPPAAVPSAPADSPADSPVTEALRALDQLDDLPLAEHPAVYERIHTSLRGALTEIDSA